MSEYTDYFALLTAAETLQQLRGEIAAVVPDAMVIALPVDPQTGASVLQGRGLEAAEAAWAEVERPAWFAISAPHPDVDTNLSALATIGPVVRVFVPEDWTSMRLDTGTDGQDWSVMIASEGWGDRWRSGIDDALKLAGPTGVGPGKAALAQAAGVTVAALEATLVEDGAASFRALFGIPDIYLFDQFLFSVDPGAGVLFDFEMDEF